MVTVLTVIKRQGEGSPIVDAAHAINHGQLPVARSTAAGDLDILSAKPAKEDDGAQAQRLVVESAVRLGAQVLSPQHTSSVGVSALNRALQARLNPPEPGKPEVQVNTDVTFRLGDKLIVGKNNYQTLCFNGETGEVVDISPEWLTLRMEDAQGERLVEYGREDWSQLQPAYAITSHRAQGSEWPSVVVVVSQSHYMMLQRNLLYTALTRARQRAVLIVSGGLENKQTGRIFKTALELVERNQLPLHERRKGAVLLVPLMARSPTGRWAGDSRRSSAPAAQRPTATPGGQVAHGARLGGQRAGGYQTQLIVVPLDGEPEHRVVEQELLGSLEPFASEADRGAQLPDRRAFACAGPQHTQDLGGGSARIGARVALETGPGAAARRDTQESAYARALPCAVPGDPSSGWLQATPGAPRGRCAAPAHRDTPAGPAPREAGARSRTGWKRPQPVDLSQQCGARTRI